MKFNDVLTEGLSSIVHHQTDIQSAVQIMKSNSFRLTLMSGTSAERRAAQGKKVFYMSTFRSKGNRFDNHGGDVSVTFVLNGRKLNAKNKGFPFDYFHDEHSDYVNPQSFESEDRIISDKPYIKNANTYIKEIHIGYNEKQSSPREKLALRKFLLEVKLSRIPYFVYDDTKTYRFQFKKKAIDIDISTLKDINIPKDGLDSYARRSGARHIKMTRNFFKGITELLYSNVNQRLSEDAYEFLYQIKFYGWSGDANRQLDAEVHNNQKSPEILRLVRAMQDLNLETLNDVINFINNKYDTNDISHLKKAA